MLAVDEEVGGLAFTRRLRASLDAALAREGGDLPDAAGDPRDAELADARDARAALRRVRALLDAPRHHTVAGDRYVAWVAVDDVRAALDPPPGPTPPTDPLAEECL